MFLVVSVFAIVHAAVSPIEHAVPIHFVKAPFAFVFSAVRPNVGSSALDIIIEELAAILALVKPFKYTVSALLAIFVVAFVDGSVGPSLNTFAMLAVV